MECKKENKKAEVRRHHTASSVHLRTELVSPQGTQISYLRVSGASGLGTGLWASQGQASEGSGSVPSALRGRGPPCLEAGPLRPRSASGAESEL